jgi:DNA repair protein SbcC/Rad50
LRTMSSERYELIREIGKDKRAKSGLDLFVFDNQTRQIRPVDSLSGGETFYCSLALALGLADAATTRAGGRKLETLFIDEGFGSLDASTRDEAINTLMDLVGENRMVGIISHVQDIKERFMHQCIEVRISPKGSFLDS